MSEVITPVLHLGVIPDGGRRWARMNGVPLIESYRLSMQKLVRYAQAVYRHGTEAISIYMLSRHNLKRQPDELSAVFVAESEFILSCLDNVDARIRIAGDTSIIPVDMANIALDAERQSCGRARTLFLCIAYDPFDELRAATQVPAQVDIGDSLIQKLWVNRRLDLVIRTGGGVTLSEFLPLQSSYARLIFLEELFNETSEELILGLIRDHEVRHFLRGE